MAERTIAWHELYAVVLGLAMFGSDMSYKYIAMYIDNQAVLHCVNSGVWKDPVIMLLIRALYYYVTRYNIRYRAFYVSSIDNGPTDSLSRNDLARFRSLCPNADTQPVQLNQVKLDF